MIRVGQQQAAEDLPLYARPADDNGTPPPTAPLASATPAAEGSVQAATPPDRQSSSSANGGSSSRLDSSPGCSSTAAPSAAAADAAAPGATISPTIPPGSGMNSRLNSSSSSSRFDSSSEQFSSNALDIDQVLAPHHLRNRLPAALTYQQATAGDNPAPPPAQQQQQDEEHQQQQQASNEVAIDDVDFLDLEGALHASRYSSSIGAGRGPGQDMPRGSSSSSTSQQQQRLSLMRQLGRPVDECKSDFPSGGLELVKHFNLDGIFLEKQEVVTHDVSQPAEPDQEQQQQEQQQDSRHQRPSKQQQQQRQKQQQQQEGPSGLLPPSSARHASSRASTSRKYKQQQQVVVPQLRYSQPRPHPLNLKPRHVKTHFKVPTSDGWKLHMIRTQVQGSQPSHHHPVILCPGLGSSGAYSFDLSPNVSLADYLASKGWDVWTCELRGNGMSDKPSLFSSRSRWWTIDDHVEKDVPAIIRFVLKGTHSKQVHFLGHSMGGMILCGVMARVDITTAKICSCIAVGSGLYLEESWWRLFERFKLLSHTFWIVPSGSMLRAYSRLMFGPWRIPYIDALYFWPGNVDPHVGRAMMRRNFSNISVGVIQQMVTAFGPKGLLSADKRVVYADPGRLAKVSAPALFLVGDRDRMCPAEGCRKTWQMFGSPDKRFICLGPAAGFSDHYGHFDILMGKKVEKEVFPLIHNFLLRHDSPRARM